MRLASSYRAGLRKIASTFVSEETPGEVLPTSGLLGPPVPPEDGGRPVEAPNPEHAGHVLDGHAVLSGLDACPGRHRTGADVRLGAQPGPDEHRRDGGAG